MKLKMIKFVTTMNTEVMKLKEIRNASGALSAVLIPADEIRELKESLKTGSKFFDYFDSLQAEQEQERRNLEQRMPNGLSVAETNDRMAKVTEDLYRGAFAKGVPMYYHDERTNEQNEFIRANPDGSEDLILFDIESRKDTFIKQVAAVGKGKWAYLAAKG